MPICSAITTSPDALKLSVEGKFAQTRATTSDYYIGTYGTPISLDNPFVPAAIRDAALAAGQDQVSVTRDNLDLWSPRRK